MGPFFEFLGPESANLENIKLSPVFDSLSGTFNHGEEVKYAIKLFFKTYYAKQRTLEQSSD